MRVLLLFIFVFSFANDANEILKTIPKNNKEYSLDVVLVNKINNLKYKKTDFNIQKTAISKEYLNQFLKLVEIKKRIQRLPDIIKSFRDKISILKNLTTPTDKLQTIYYQNYLDISLKELNYLKSNFPKWEKILIENLDLVNIRKNNDILKLKAKLLKVNTKLSKLNIELQKWQLLDNKFKILSIQKEIDKVNLKKIELYKQLLNNQLIVWFKALKDKDKDAFQIDDKILSYAKKIDMNLYTAITQVVVDFENSIFGSKALIYSTQKEIKLFFVKLWDILNYPLFHISKTPITAVNFILFFIVFFIGVMIGKYYKRFIYNLKHTKNISYSTATLLANMGYYTILTITFLMSLKVIGLDLSSLAIVAGALSVGIGFGLQNIVSNFVSGIIMMFEKTIKVGDYIEIDNETRGEVIDISMRSTIIRTNDNINLIIPNQSFIQNNVINWTLGDDIVRFRVPFGVAYGTDIDKVENVILGALHNSDLPYVKNKNGDYEIRVIFEEMADSSLNFELFVWVKGEYARRPRRTRSEFLKTIYKALNKAGISIPFPQIDLHIVDSVPIEINIKGENNVK